MTGSLSQQTAKERTRLQRLFSTFPSGRPGMGLLLLRTVAGVVALLQGGAIAFGAEAAGPVEWVTALLAVVSGAALLVGFLTPIASALLALVGAVATFHGVGPASLILLGDPLAALLVVSIAVATACLGPGAFSLDAWLFGRRELLIRR